ncbi:MAG: hypothetical protein NT141_01855 [candidate division WWE3 bacterium]|nr:hypothetical protein [candidate division WWE3 bacterium]
MKNENKRDDEVTSITPETIREELPSHIEATVKAAKDPQGQEKGFGFVIIPEGSLTEHPEVLGGARVDGATLRSWERKGVFVHASAISGHYQREPLEGLVIVPQKIGINPRNGMYAVTEAQTAEAYKRDAQATRIQALAEQQKKQAEAAREKAETERSQQIFDQLVAKGHHLDSESLWGIAKSYARFYYANDGRYQQGDLQEQLAQAEISATTAVKRQKYEEALPGIRAWAQEEATKCGGVVEEVDWPKEIRIVLKEEPKEYQQASAAYGRAAEVDKWLAQQKLVPVLPKTDDNTNYAGRFTGGRVTVHSWYSPGDMYSNRGGSSSVSYEVVPPTDQPVAEVVIWNRRLDGVTVDRLAESADLRANFPQILNKWTEAAELAEAYQRTIELKEAQEAEAKKQAAEYIEWLTNKVYPPIADKVDVTQEKEWLGLPVITKSWYDHSDVTIRSVLVRSCEVDIPGFGALDLIRHGYWPDDVRPAAAYLKEQWDRQQPEEAVVANETKDEALTRLIGFAFKEENLPTIPGMDWKISGALHQAQAFADAQKETLAPAIPKVPGEWDQKHEQYYTHDLVLSGRGLPDTVISSIYFRAGRRGNGYLAEVEGSPNYRVDDLFKAHPELDPRQIRATWKVVEPPKTS